MRNADRPEILHRTTESPAVDVLVSFEANFPDFDLGAFFDHEGDAHRGRRNRPHFGAHRRKLPSVL